MNHMILHFLPVPAKGALALMSAAAMLAVVLILAATRLPGAMDGDFRSVTNLVVLGVPLVLVAAWCLWFGSTMLAPHSRIGAAGLTVAVAGWVATMLFLVVPFPKLQIARARFQKIRRS